MPELSPKGGPAPSYPSSSCPSCPSAPSCPSGESPVQEEDALPPRTRPRGVRFAVAVGSGKGGVGKSTVTALLGVGLARRGKRVGILDADLTGPSIPRLLNLTDPAMPFGDGILPARSSRWGISAISINLLLEDPENPVIWRGPLLGGVVRQFWNDVSWGELDVLLVDLPPGTSDAPLTLLQTADLDGFLGVTTPQGLAGMVVEKSLRMVDRLGVPILGLVENWSSLECPFCGERTRPFGGQAVDVLGDRWGVKERIRLPLDPELMVRGDRGDLEDYDNPAVMEPLLEGFFRALPGV